MTPFRFLMALAMAASGCTSFSTVRPATITPGPSFLMQASMAAPPGDEASWFYSFDCASNCDRSIPSTDLVLSYGRVPSGGTGMPFTLGVGVNGLTPYVEGYVQLSRSAAPFGLGARVGSMGSWSEHQVYLRFEKTVAENTKLLWNPGVLVHTGNSPNGDNPGTLRALVNGFGIEAASGSVAVTPSASVVWSRAEHRSGSQQHGPETRFFITAAMSMTLRRDTN